jgi:hypothetical protein
MIRSRSCCIEYGSTSAEAAPPLPRRWFWRSSSLLIMIRNGQEEVRAALAG